MKRKIIISLLCVLAVVGVLFAVPALAAGENEASTTVTTAEDLISAVGGGYAYVKLGADLTVELSGQELVVDLAGYDLNVSGKGEVKAFDSANDTFDHTECGTLTYSGVTCAATFTAPEAAGGNYYIGIGGNGKYSFHRMDMKITSVVFRPSAAGMYYKAYFNCDRLVEELVTTYGVAVSLDAMPGKNFKTQEHTEYTAMDASEFRGDTTVNSGLVQNILQDNAGVSAAENTANANKKINARLYINLEGYGDIMAPTYSANSLNDLLEQLDSGYAKLGKITQEQLDDFYNTWKAKNEAGWTFTNIAKTTYDFDAMNAPLQLDENNQAPCWACGGKTVTWTLLPAGEVTAAISTQANGHYCLTGDVTYLGTDKCYFNALKANNVNVCLHLNEHNITAQETKAFSISNSILNVMGNGTVAGYSAKADEGAIVHAQNRSIYNGINLFGGTYTRVVKDDVAASKTAPIISLEKKGRAIDIYQDVTIEGGSGVAFYDGSVGNSDSRQKEGYVGFYGCTINGNVKFRNMADTDIYPLNLEIKDAKINGTLTLGSGHRVTIAGAPEIKNLVVPSNMYLTTKTLEPGAKISVTADGYFTNAVSGLAAYVDYFTATDAAEGVFLRNNKLYCGKDYVSDLNVTITQKTEKVKETVKETITDPETGEQTEVETEIEKDVTVDVHTAYCPVCEKDVTWTVLTQEVIDTHVPAASDYNEDDPSRLDYFYTFNGKSEKGNTHYYLSEDIEYTGTAYYSFLHQAGGNGTACFHLNGHNVTSTKRTAIYSNSSTLNIMGTGTITGKARSSSYGAAVHSNNGSSVYNFYSGTYAALAGDKTSGATAYIGGASGRFYFYEDAVIEGVDLADAIYLKNKPSKDSVLSLKGSTVNGNISANGKGTGKTWTLILDDATINGTLTAKDSNEITLLNDVKIDLLDVSEDSKINLTDGMTEGDILGSDAFVTVKNPGAFAWEYDAAESLASCFRTAWRDDKIVVRDSVLTYKPNYEMGLQYNSEGKARCPICQDYVTWTAVTEETASVKFTDGGHYYLNKDLTFDVDSDKGAYLISGNADTTTCLHLNGHDITSKQEAAIAVSGGVINVMGEGTVLGASTNANGGSAVLANNATATNGANLYSGIYKKFNASSDKPVISIKENGGNITIYEDAVIDAEGGVAIYTGAAAENSSNLTLDNVMLTGDMKIAGNTENSVVSTHHITVNGTVFVSGTNAITFAGKTVIPQLTIEKDSLVNFENMHADSNVKVSAEGVFTTSMGDRARRWVNYFSTDAENSWIIPSDNALYLGPKATMESTDDQSVQEALDAGYAGLSAKYGEMHNHTSAGLRADGRNTLAEWKERMIQLEMDFAVIVDHHQVAHMYHDDWQEEPTEESPVVFIGGSEPASTLQELSPNATQSTLHYNMITGDVDKLISILSDTTRFKKFNYKNSTPYDDNVGLLKWSYEKKLYNGVVNNKYKKYDPTEYSKDPDGNFDNFDYASWTRTEFEQLVAAFHEVGGLLVHVHPKGSGYIVSTNFMDYCFSGDAGSDESAAMGFEIFTAGYGNKPSRTAGEQAYQTWLDMLEAGKKVYATYGDDTHKLPTAMSLTTIYGPEGANSAYYMAKMNAGNFAPGWVGIRMMVGDTQMGGTADTFEGQRLMFSIGDMYEANDYSRMYRDKANKDQILTWEPGYDASCTYTVRLYDDSGLLKEDVGVNPSEMNYYAFDAEPDAKFYRVEVWVEKLNEDGTSAYRYRCGVGNPIWNAAAYATAE